MLTRGFACRQPAVWSLICTETVRQCIVSARRTIGPVQQELRQKSKTALTPGVGAGTLRLVPRSRTQQDSGRWCTSSRRRGTREGRRNREVAARRRGLEGGKPARAFRKECGNPVRVGDLWARFLGTPLCPDIERPGHLRRAFVHLEGLLAYGRYTSLATGDSQTATSATRTRAGTVALSRSQITRARFSAVGLISPNGSTSLMSTWS